MNPRLSPAALLIVTAFVAVVALELRTLFLMLGVDVSVGVAAGIGALAIVAIWVWAFLPSASPAGDSENGSEGSNHHRAD